MGKICVWHSKVCPRNSTQNILAICQKIRLYTRVLNDPYHHKRTFHNDLKLKILQIVLKLGNFSKLGTEPAYQQCNIKERRNLKCKLAQNLYDKNL